MRAIRRAWARNPDTGYQALFRYGGHQSCTRGFPEADAHDRHAGAQEHDDAAAGSRL